MEKNKKKILAMIGAVVALVVVGTTYAFVTRTLTGTKKVTITAGTLSLVLNEGNAITISDALPMYDQVGMIQEDVFEFDLINNTSNPTDYVLKLTKIASANELSTSDVKYYLTKEGVGEAALLSSLTDGVIDTGTIVGNDTIDYTLRLWIDSSVTSNEAISGKSLSYRIDVEASMVEENSNKTVTFAGITKEVNETVDAMFNYTSEGVDSFGGDSVDATNGIYAMEDDDGPSYFYRGEVNNLVKFGSYTKDYYVYSEDNFEFLSLEDCQMAFPNCVEANKKLKHSAGTPMYWRIIRVNGDGTIRMIYAGTTPDATGNDTGIGVSSYTKEVGNPKYAGYTFDNTIIETKSAAKTGIDNWYSDVFEGTTYDSQIATGKFCSDSSGYGYDTEFSQMFEPETYSFASFKRNFANMFGKNSEPTFKCTSEVDVNIGGSYDLKAGLITIDEIVAAGGNALTSNFSYYLYNGTKGNYDGIMFWSMSPCSFLNRGYVRVFHVDNGGAASFIMHASEFQALLRPVINLRSDVVFKEGTDGSTTSPYELAE